MSDLAHTVTAEEVAEGERLEARCAAARRTLKKRETERDAHRAKLRDRIPLNDSADRGDVHELHGFTVRRIKKSNGRRFDLKGYLVARNGRLPAALKPFVTESTYDQWEIARAE